MRTNNGKIHNTSLVNLYDSDPDALLEALRPITKKESPRELIDLDSYFDSKALPEFPIEAVKNVCPVFYDMVKAVADNLQVPIDLPAGLALSTIGVTLAGHVSIEIRPDAAQPVVIWTMCALPPGERKSPALDKIKKPIVDHVIDWEEANKFAVMNDKQKRFINEKRCQELEKKAIAAKDENERQAYLKELELLNIDLLEPEKTNLRLLIDDATPEAVAEVLVSQKGRIACLTDEGTFLEIAAGRYGKPNYELYMRGWGGQDCTIDRRGRPPIHLKEIFLTLGIAIQPDVLYTIAGDVTAVERGFLPRFLMSVPKSRLGTRDCTDLSPFPLEIEHAWGSQIRKLLQKQKKRVLTPNFAKVTAWEQRWEPHYAPNGQLAPISGWCGKAISGQMLKVAAALHCAAGNQSEEVSDETIDAAIAIIEYYLAHTKRIFKLASNAELRQLCKKLRDWCIDRPDTTMSYRTLVQYPGKHTDKELVREAYDVLIKCNYLTERTVGKKTVFDLHPSLVGKC